MTTLLPNPAAQKRFQPGIFPVLSRRLLGRPRKPSGLPIRFEPRGVASLLEKPLLPNNWSIRTLAGYGYITRAASLSLSVLGDDQTE
jgi:hypothetical protein